MFHMNGMDDSIITKKYDNLLKTLLYDNSSKKNIIWATSNYCKYGKGFCETDYITEKCLLGKKPIIKPRIKKSKKDQKRRSRDMAEVFTPAWMCNRQNNVIDNAWFGYESAFNIETKNGWQSTKKVNFKDKKWQDYVDLERMEITCGEAPYLTSRYDVVSGEYIEPMNRIGLLDRKLRVVCENVSDKDEWLRYATLAYQRIYGYDYQGDNLLIARENLLLTFIDFYMYKFSEEPSVECVESIAKIISWNIWQMDALKFVVPFSCHKQKPIQMSLFPEDDEELVACEGCENGDSTKHNGIYCIIKDWRTNKRIKFIEL